MGGEEIYGTGKIIQGMHMPSFCSFPYFEMLIYAQIKCWRNFMAVSSDHANAAISEPRWWVIFHASACYITDFYLFIYFAYPVMFYVIETELLVRAP